MSTCCVFLFPMFTYFYLFKTQDYIHTCISSSLYLAGKLRFYSQWKILFHIIILICRCTHITVICIMCINWEWGLNLECATWRCLNLKILLWYVKLVIYARILHIMSLFHASTSALFNCEILIIYYLLTNIVPVLLAHIHCYHIILSCYHINITIVINNIFLLLNGRQTR